jgi:hypothetical protein
MTNATFAEEAATQSVKAASVTEEKAGMASLFTRLLRNADRATNIRLVTANRR